MSLTPPLRVMMKPEKYLIFCSGLQYIYSSAILKLKVYYIVTIFIYTAFFIPFLSSESVDF